MLKNELKKLIFFTLSNICIFLHIIISFRLGLEFKYFSLLFILPTLGFTFWNIYLDSEIKELKKRGGKLDVRKD